MLYCVCTDRDYLDRFQRVTEFGKLDTLRTSQKHERRAAVYDDDRTLLYKLRSL